MRHGDDAGRGGGAGLPREGAGKRMTDLWVGSQGRGMGRKRVGQAGEATMDREILPRSVRSRINNLSCLGRRPEANG